PRETEVLDVVGGDLRQRAEPPARVVAVVARPAVRRHRLLRRRGGGSDQHGAKNESLHFCVQRNATTSWICLSVIVSSSAMCAAKGSFFTTVTSAERRKVRACPSAPRSVTLKSSMFTRSPVTACPPFGVTVTRTIGAGRLAAAGAPPRRPPNAFAGNRKRCCRFTGSVMRLATPARSRDVEWH